MSNTLLLEEEHNTDDYDNNSDELTLYVDLPNPASESPTSFCDVFKKISALAIPMGLSFTFSFEVFLAIILLQLLSESEEDTAATTLVSTWMNTVCAIFMSPLFAVAIDLSGKLGAWREEERTGLTIEEDEQDSIPIWNTGDTRESKKEKIESTNINSLLIAGVVTIPATLLLYYSAPIFTSVFGQNNSVALAAQKFLRPYAMAIPGLMARMSLEQIMFSFGETKPAMWMGLTSFAIGGSLSALLGFGAKIGSLVIPRMNQEGVAIGFVVESYLTALSYALFVKLSKECRAFDFFKISAERIRRNLDGLKDILRLGGAITFSVALDLASNLCSAILSGLVGVTQQAAMSYCLQLIYFEFIFTVAFGFSCTQEMRRELGAKRYRDAEKIGAYGLLTGLCYLTPLPLLFSIYPKGLEIVSGGATEAISKSLKILAPLMFTGNTLYSLSYNLLQQTRALNDLLVPNIITFIGISAGIGLSAGLGLGTSMGIYGVGTGYTLGVGLTASAFFLRWRHSMNKVVEEYNKTLEDAPPVKRRKLDCPSSFFCCLRNRSIDRSDIASEELGESLPLLLN